MAALGDDRLGDAIRVRCARLALTVAALLLLGLGPGVGGAGAAGQIESFSIEPSHTQAGGHPDLSVSLALGDPGNPEAAKTLALEAPPGLVALPYASFQCSAALFASSECVPGAQIGLVTVRGGYEADPESLLGTAPLYALQRGAGELARWGFAIPTIDAPVEIGVELRSGSDYGLRVTIEGLPQANPLAAADLEIWGVPTSAIHDGDRFDPGSPGNPPGCPGSADASCLTPPFPTAGTAALPFLIAPTTCDQVPTATLALRTHEDPEAQAVSEAPYPPATGCSLLSFSPSLSALPTTEEAGSGSGLDLELRVPQNLSPNLPTPSPAIAAETYFPGGLELGDRSAADGICGYEEAAIEVDGPGGCPAGAKVGTVSIESLILPGPVPGEAYFGGGDDEVELVYLLVSEGGLDLKLPLVIEDEAAFDEIVAWFPILPQLPIEEIDLHLEPSADLLETGGLCDEYAIEGFLYPWNSALSTQSFADSFSLTSGPGGSPCPEPSDGGNPPPGGGPTNPAPPPRALPAPLLRRGTAVAAATARVKGGAALLRLRCRGGGRCAGVAKLRLGRKRAGASRFAISAGESKLIRIKLNRKARKRLRRGASRLRVKLSGRGVKSRVVTLRPSRRRR